MNRRIITILSALALNAVVYAQNEGNNAPIKGDVNGDGVVNAADITAVVNIIMNGGEEVNPSSSILSSRLKDKDGKPVLLEGIKNVDEGTWFIKYDYDKNDLLKSFEDDGNQFVFDGMSYTSTNQRSDGRTETYEMSITLNENGLIDKITGTMKQYSTLGKLIRLEFGNNLFKYNKENQMIESDIANAHIEKYRDDGTLEKSEDTEFSVNAIYTWADGNLTSVGREEPSYTDGICPTKQNTMANCFFTGHTGFRGLTLLGLFGVGSANLPKKGLVTLNKNGTIASEAGNYTYYYKTEE